MSEDQVVPLTGKERECLAFIRKFSAENGYPPSIMDVAAEQENTGTVARERINALVTKGYCRRTPGVSRSIVAILDEDGNEIREAS
jgi:SOS-response transcriptional repressor LexA